MASVHLASERLFSNPAELVLPSTHSPNTVWKRYKGWKQQACETDCIALYFFVVVVVQVFACMIFNYSLCFILAGPDRGPLTDPLFGLSRFSASRFQLPRQSSRLPCASSPSTCPATAEINLRPASTASNNMCPGRVQTDWNASSAVLRPAPGFCLTLMYLQNSIVLNCSCHNDKKSQFYCFDVGQVYTSLFICIPSSPESLGETVAARCSRRGSLVIMSVFFWASPLISETCLSLGVHPW